MNAAVILFAAICVFTDNQELPIHKRPTAGGRVFIFMAVRSGRLLVIIYRCTVASAGQFRT